MLMLLMKVSITNGADSKKRYFLTLPIHSCGNAATLKKQSLPLITKH